MAFVAGLRCLIVADDDVREAAVVDDERAAALFAGQTPDELSRQKIDELERVIGQLTVELTAAKKLSALLS